MLGSCDSTVDRCRPASGAFEQTQALVVSRVPGSAICVSLSGNRLCQGIAPRPAVDRALVLRIAKARSIQQHLMRFPPGEVGEADRRSRALKCEEPVAPDARETGEDFRQLLAAHALD